MSYWWSETSCPDLVDDVDGWSKNLKDTPPIWLQATRLTAFSSFNQCIGIWDWFRCTEDDSYFTAIVASGQSSAPYAPCFPPVNPTRHDNYVWRVMTFPQSACISYFFQNRRLPFVLLISLDAHSSWFVDPQRNWAESAACTQGLVRRNLRQIGLAWNLEELRPGVVSWGDPKLAPKLNSSCWMGGNQCCLGAITYFKHNY